MRGRLCLSFVLALYHCRLDNFGIVPLSSFPIFRIHLDVDFLTFLAPPLFLQLDYILMFVGSLCAVGAGIVMPVFSIIFGDIIDAFHGPRPFFEVDANIYYLVLRE